MNDKLNNISVHCLAHYLVGHQIGKSTFLRQTELIRTDGNMLSIFR